MMTGYVQGVNTEGEPLRDWYVEHNAVVVDCQTANDGMTRQEFAAECDINVLLDRYEKTGVMNHINGGVARYLDLSEGVPDLMSAMAVLHRATDAFMTLPAKVRREFDNDPVKFVSFAEDPTNLGTLRDWGLAPPLEPVATEISSPAAVPPAAVPPVSTGSSEV